MKTILLGLILSIAALAQTPGPQETPRDKPAVKAGPMPRGTDGKPDFQGVWEVRSPGGNAAYDVEDHLKQVYGIPPGKGVIVDPKDGKIPYLPAAAQRKQDLVAHHMYDDPEAHCFLSGIPRQVYAPFGFQILQPANYVLFLFENFHAYRVIPTDGRPHLPSDIKTFDGDSRGRWEGDTLVVDVTNQNDKTWFDMAGNFHSDALHVVERYTPVDANTIDYRATIEDAKTFSRPWTIAFPITRIVRPGYEIMELACVEGENLLGLKTVLPDAAAGHPAVIVIGFTHASQSQTKAWAARLQHQLPVYTIAVLEDAPRLVRGMAVHGMKGGVPEDQRDHFIVIYHNEKELKQAAGFDAQDDAYVLLLDKDGGIRWRFHGPMTDAAIEQLKSQAAAQPEQR